MISIIDYGLGNIKAFANIYKRLDMPFKIVKTTAELEGATKIILPGVGSFDQAMKSLDASGMRPLLNSLIMEKQVPVLGVCVGMQMLAKHSDEGSLQGLGWIDGSVKKFDTTRLKAFEPLPHMGWNTVTQLTDSPLFLDLPQNAKFYFLHSYFFECNDKQNILAQAHYSDDFACVVNSGNIYGIQCHPEKSHESGVLFLKNFGNL